MPRQSAGTSPTAADLITGLTSGLQLYLDPTQCKPQQWAAASSVITGSFGYLQRARYANVVTPMTTGYAASGQRFTSLKFFAAPTIGNYLLADINEEGWSFDTGASYAATLRFGPSIFGLSTAGPWSREILENIVYEMNGVIKQTGREANAATIENWGLNTPDVSPQVVISSGTSQNITSITRLNNTVTVTLAGALTVPGGNGIGMVNVSNVVDLGFVGTFVVLTGAGTATLSWAQEGLNTSSTGGTTDTDILKSIGRSYSYAWENANKPHVSAPSPSTQFIAYSNQNGIIELIEQGTVAVVAGSTAVTGTGTAFTSAWVGRRIWISTTSGPTVYDILSVTDATHLVTVEPWAGATGAGHVFQIYDFDVTNVRLYQTADGGATYFEVQRNTFDPTAGTLLGAGLLFFDNANAEPPDFPFTSEVSQLNNVPPPVGAFVKEYQGVLVVYGGTIPGQTFFYSNQTLTTVGLQQESFAPLNQITLPIQNAVINGMVELPGALIIWSDKQDMFRLTGLLTDNTAAATPTQQGATITALPYNLGCASPFAVALTPLGVIWVSSNAEVWLFTDSYAPRNIGQPVQSILRSIDPADLPKCRMSYYHTFNRDWVALSVPVEGTSGTNKVLVLDLNLLSSQGSPSYFVFDMASNQPVWYSLDIPSDAPTPPVIVDMGTETAISVPDGGGEQPWTNPSNATLDTPGTYTTVALGSGGTSGIGAFDTGTGAFAGTGTAVNTGSVTPANPTELALHGVAIIAGNSYTPAGGWTAFGDLFAQVVTGSIAGTGTLGFSNKWAAGVALFDLFGGVIPTIVQTATIDSGSLSTGTFTQSFPNPVVAGNTILVVQQTGSVFTPPAGMVITDNNGDTFTQLLDIVDTSSVANPPEFSLWSAPNINAGSPVVKAVISGSNGTSNTIAMYEIQGGAAGDSLSEQLQCTNFGFSIPSEASIQGIIIEVGGHQNNASPNALIETQLINPTGTVAAVQLASADALAILGSPTEQWGLILTPALVNSSTFGVQVKAFTLGGVSATFSIYTVRLRVFYTLPDGLAGPGAVPLETVYETAGNVRLEAGGFDLVTDLDYQRGGGTEIPVQGASITTHAWGNDSPFILKRPKFFRFNTNRDPSQLATENIVGITNISRTLGQVTALTTAPHGLDIGDYIFVNTVADSGFDGAFQVTAVPTDLTVQWNQALPNASSIGGSIESGWSFSILGIDDDFYGFDNPLQLDLVPGLNDTASLGGNPAQFQFGSPFRISQELYKVGGVNFVMGRRLQFKVNFPSTPGVDYQMRSIQIGFGPTPPR